MCLPHHAPCFSHPVKPPLTPRTSVNSTSPTSPTSRGGGGEGDFRIPPKSASRTGSTSRTPEKVAPKTHQPLASAPWHSGNATPGGHPGSVFFDPVGRLDGETVLVSPTGGPTAKPGAAIADITALSSSPVSQPVRVVVTNYRMIVSPPDVAGATLHVTVCSGNDLKKHADPYAVLSLTGVQNRSIFHSRRTRTLPKTADADWNESFVFAGVHADAGLKIELYGKAETRTDEYMGEVLIHGVARQENETCTERRWALTVPVQQNGTSGKGALRVRLHCKWGATASSLLVPFNSFPLMCIEEVKTLNKPEHLEISTKGVEKFKLEFDSASDAADVYTALSEQPDDNDHIFCRCPLSRPVPALKVKRRQFSWHRELERWTTQRDGVRGSPPDLYEKRWRVDASINAGFKACSTYPLEVVLPSEVTPEHVEASCNFRTKRRFPIVSWVHPCNGAMLARSSQPKVGTNMTAWTGVTDGRDGDWECLMKFTADQSNELTICDARPWVNAMANRLGGGGSEYDLGYKGCAVRFLAIDNIHAMREKLHTLRAGVCQQDDFEQSSNDVSQWLQTIHAVLKGATLAAEMVECGTSVLVHCSDGWDRTSQVASLASLILDGHYRTIDGFVDLIHKDWLLPGHRFTERHGLVARKEQSTRFQAPIFMQFLDCTAQIWCVYPRHFEYNLHLLAYVVYHSYSGRYSTFLGNNEQERQECPAPGPDIWEEVLRDKDKWQNSLYDPNSARSPIMPCTIPLYRLRFSEEVYMGFAVGRPAGGPTGGASTLGPFFAMGGTSSTLRADQKDLHSENSSFSSGNADGDTSPVSPKGNTSPASVGDTPPKPFFAPAEPTSPQAGAVASAAQGKPVVLRTQVDPKWQDAGNIFCCVAPGAQILPSVLACERLLCVFFGVDSFPPNPRVKVAGHTVHGGHTHFVIEMSSNTDTGTATHFVTRRYREFSDLRKSLREANIEPPGAQFPSKTLSRCQGGQLADRLTRLDAWLAAVVYNAWRLGTLDGDHHTQSGIIHRQRTSTRETPASRRKTAG